MGTFVVHVQVAAKLGFVDTATGAFNDRVVWAGDSENDAPMLSTGIAGIVVGNCTAGIRAACQGSAAVVLTKATNADGVLEGLAHYGLAD